MNVYIRWCKYITLIMLSSSTFYKTTEGTHIWNDITVWSHPVDNNLKGNMRWPFNVKTNPLDELTFSAKIKRHINTFMGSHWVNSFFFDLQWWSVVTLYICTASLESTFKRERWFQASFSRQVEEKLRNITNADVLICFMRLNK